MWFWYSLFLICSLFFNGHALNNGFENEDLLFITISSNGDYYPETFIEMNWEFTTKVPDTLALYHDDPVNNTEPIYSLNITGITKGNITTNIPIYIIEMTSYLQQGSTKNSFFGAACLSLWIGAFQNNTLIQKNCLAIQPSWMQDLNNTISDIPMNKLFIPGTHDAACYDSFLDDTYDLRAVKKVIYTQNESIYQQLVFGIRYFDIRISALGNNTNNEITYWINHGPFQVLRLRDFITPIRVFLQMFPNEVIIVDIHDLLEGFGTDEQIIKLVEYLEEAIGNLMIPRSMQTSPQAPTLNQIWQQSKRLIVCFKETRIAQNSTYLWDRLSQNWGNVMEKDDLKTYLESVNQNPNFLGNNNPFWAAMAELTADATYTVLGVLSPNASYSDLAQIINKDVTEWYRKDWCYTANIVAVDYYHGNDIINVAIHCNLKRSLMRQNNI